MRERRNIPVVKSDNILISINNFSESIKRRIWYINKNNKINRKWGEKILYIRYRVFCLFNMFIPRK